MTFLPKLSTTKLRSPAPPKSSNAHIFHVGRGPRLTRFHSLGNPKNVLVTLDGYIMISSHGTTPAFRMLTWWKSRSLLLFVLWLLVENCMWSIIMIVCRVELCLLYGGFCSYLRGTLVKYRMLIWCLIVWINLLLKETSRLHLCQFFVIAPRLITMISLFRIGRFGVGKNLESFHLVLPVLLSFSD